MRFGKRILEVTMNSRANEPYVNYKTLKHSVSKLSALLCEEQGKVSDDDDCSTGDEDALPSKPNNRRGSDAARSMGAAVGAASSSAAAGPGSAASSTQAPVECNPAVSPQVKAYQNEFFRRVDADVAQAKAHVESTMAMLEISVGEWQASAIVAGILFTPDILDDVSAQLPFQVQGQEVLVEWLMGLQRNDEAQETRKGLIDKYSAIANTLNRLLLYIEVNLTAVRKIFKKFEKKVPAESRIMNVREYRAHHDLFMPSMQQLLMTVVHMQRLMRATVDPNIEAEASTISISQIGPESLALLRGPAFDEVLVGPPSRIDVYAKPGTSLGNGAASQSGRAVANKAAALEDSSGPGPRGGTGIAGGSVGSGGNAGGAGSSGHGKILEVGVQRAGAQGCFQGPLGVDPFQGPPKWPQHPTPAAGSSSASGAASTQQEQLRAMGGVFAGPHAHEQGHGSQEQEGAKSGGRRRGGRNNRGGGKGRRADGGSGPAAPVPAGLAHSGGGKDGGASSRASAGPAAAAGAQGAHGYGQGGGKGGAGAPPPQFFTQVPLYVGKGGPYQLGQGAVAAAAGTTKSGGHGRSGGYPDGTGAAFQGNVQQGKVQTFDPNWVAAAMMPMFWPTPGGLVPMAGMPPHLAAPGG